MSRTPLDPEEALAGPLYVVAGLLVVVPALDFALSLAAPQLSSVQWRFASVGLLSGFTLTPILGITIALGVAGGMRHVLAQRLLVVTCLAGSLLLLVLSLGFLLDVAQLRASVPPEGRPAFSNAWQRALAKHVLSAIALGYLGWKARRMIPTGPRPRTPRSVHVVTK